MHNNVDGDIIKNAAGNSEKVIQHCFRPYDPKCQILRVRHLVQVSTFNLDCSLLSYDSRIQ